MAFKNVPATSAMAETVSLDSDRLTIARHATGEVEALLRMLRRETDAEDDSNCHEVVLRSSLTRILALNSVIMSVIGMDDLRAVEEMR